MLWLIMSISANADTFTLDNGAVIEGQMVVYNYGGECQMSIIEGALVGSIVIIPCDRIDSFSRSRATLAPPMEVPSLTAAAIEQALTEPAVIVAEPVPVELAIVAEPVPVAAPVPVEEVAEAPIEEPLPVEEVELAPEVVEIAAVPVEAPFAAESVAEPVPEVSDPIEEEPEVMAATPWADESGEPADGTVRPEPTQPERRIGGVAIPALPNLRLIRTVEPEVAPESVE